MKRGIYPRLMLVTLDCRKYYGRLFFLVGEKHVSR